MDGAMRYIDFSGYYYNFGECKEKNRSIARHKCILNYL